MPHQVPALLPRSPIECVAQVLGGGGGLVGEGATGSRQATVCEAHRVQQSPAGGVAAGYRQATAIHRMPSAPDPSMA